LQKKEDILIWKPQLTFRDFVLKILTELKRHCLNITMQKYSQFIIKKCKLKITLKTK